MGTRIVLLELAVVAAVFAVLLYWVVLPALRNKKDKR